MQRRGAMVLLALVAAFGLCVGPAGAAGHHHRHHRHHRDVVVVDDNRHGGCHGRPADFRTIQAAIDDPDTEPGDTILVCPGEYDEVVKVTKPRLTLEGANAGRDATRQRRRHESVVTNLDPDGTVATVQLLADDITWNGFTVRGVFGKQNGPGMATSPDHSGYLVRDTVFEDNGIGLHLGANGARPTVVCRNRFVANNEVDAGGYGVFADTRARRALITYNKFQRHNGAGIFFADRGGVQQDVLIDHNRSVDDLSFATIYNSSRVHVTHNSVRARVGDPKFPGPASAIFIGARNDQVLVHRNRVHRASGNGIDVTDSAEPRQGKPGRAPTRVAVSKNKVEHAQLAGLHMAAGSSAVSVTANLALDNTEWDCRDDSKGTRTARTANTWLDNLGGTSLPRGLCGPPPPDHGKRHHHHKKKHKKKDPCGCDKHRRMAV